jgi:hypothetical protein
LSDTGSGDIGRIALGRILLALGVGALVGGLVTIILFAVSAYLLPSVGPGVEAQVDFSFGVVGTWAALGLISIGAWAAGLTLIGGPAWFVMHRMGLRARFHAMTIGALLAGGAGYVFGALAYAPYPTAWFVAFALIGMAVGYIIWRLCYGRKSLAREASE